MKALVMSSLAALLLGASPTPAAAQAPSTSDEAKKASGATAKESEKAGEAPTPPPKK